MNNEVYIRTADRNDIETIGQLARVIWPVAYGSTLTTGQIEYMLDLFYTPDALITQMESEGQNFIIAEIGNEAVGFAAFGALDEPGVYKLHKLYVLSGLQGKGVGRMLLNNIAEKLATENALVLRLNVNRHNPARHFYHKLGFEITRETVKDIGNGFVMDDYVMEKKLP